MLELIDKENLVGSEDLLLTGIKEALQCNDLEAEEMIDGIKKGYLELRVAKSRVNNSETLYGFVISMIVHDALFQKKPNLIISVIYGTKHVTEDIWRECFNDMKLVALKYGCGEIKGFTSNPRLKEVLLRLGCKQKDLIYLEL